MTLPKIIFFFKKHYLIILVTLLVGFVSVLPQIIAVVNLGDKYQGMPFMYTPNEDVYLARIREVVDGHNMVGSAFFYEYKNQFPLMPAIAENLYALPTVLFSVPLVDVLYASKFILPAFLFLLVYYFILSLSYDRILLSSRINAMVGGLFTVLGYDLVDYRYFFNLIQGHVNTVILPLWTRPINPITGAIFIFIFLLLIWGMIYQKKKYNIIFGAIIWVFSLGYIFSWTLILSVVFLSVLLCLKRKDFISTKRLLLMVLLWLILASPYWYGIIHTVITPGGDLVAARYGMFFTHLPIVNKFIFVVSLLFAGLSAYFKFYKKEKERDDNWWYFCLVLVLSCWIVFNQQIITGRTVWFHHYVQYTIPICISVVMVLINNWVKPKFTKIWFATLIVVFSSVCLWNILALRTIKYQQNVYAKLQNYAPVMSWFNSNAPKDCVVLNQQADNPEVVLDLLIPAFTHCNTYAPSWLFDGVTEERILHDYLVILKLKGVGPDDIKNYLENNEVEVRSYFYANWDQLFGYGSDPYIKQKINQIALAYQDFTWKDFTTELKKYKLDYILLTSQPTPATSKLLSTLKMKLVYNNNNFYIYEF